MDSSQRATLFVLAAAFLVAVGHSLRVARTSTEADQYEVLAQKLKPFLSAESRLNIVEEFSKNKIMMRSRSAFFPVMLFHEKEQMLDTVLWVRARKNTCPAGRPAPLEAQKVLCRHQDDSNVYILLVR